MLLIGIDVDETVAELHEAWLGLYNRDYNDTLTPADIWKWEIDEFVKPECGKKIFRYLDDPTLYDLVKPIPGAREAVHALAEIGEVVFITKCHNQDTAVAKAEWLGRHMGLTSWIYPIFRGESKNKVGADILIDDYAVNVEGFNGWGILVNRPHNRRSNCTKLRVNHISDAIAPIKTRIQTLANFGLSPTDTLDSKGMCVETCVDAR